MAMAASPTRPGSPDGSAMPRLALAAYIGPSVLMLGGMLMQPMVGFVLDRYWTGATDNGVRLYDFSAWQRGFSLMLLWAAAALVVLFFLREGRAGKASST